MYALSLALARAGETVELFTTEPGRHETREDRGLSTRTFPRVWPQRLCIAPQLDAALQTTDADVFHHHSVWLRTLHYAHRRARTRGLLVVSPRGMMSAWAIRHRPWRKRLARALVHPGALEAVDGWHATSAEEEAEIRALGFSQPVCVAPNGIDAPAEADVQRGIEYWHEVCPASATRPVALFYSRFHPKKRVIELIDLWLEHGPRDWLLLLVGIPQDYTPEILDAYAAKMSGAGRVAAFSGHDAPAPYPIASLFLLPSHNENFGLVIAESMAHGVPVLVTDTTPWRSVRERECGWCVPWDDYGAALQSATAESAGTLTERGRRAREWVLRDFSWDTAAQRVAGFYHALGAPNA